MEIQPLLDDSKQASKLEAEFAEILGPLEAEAGASLKGWGRQKCLAAFVDRPLGFQACATEALDRGRNPIALLVQMVKDGDHEQPVKIQAPRLEAVPSPPPPRGHGVCFNCGREADDAFSLRGAWWCPEHEGLAPA